MPFSEQSTSRPAASQSLRGRSSATEASIDDILASIRQIIDEEPMTARGSAAARSELARSGAVEKSARAPAHVLPRKRAARVLTPMAEDDVLAELLAPPTAAPAEKSAPEQVQQVSIAVAEIESHAVAAVSATPEVAVEHSPALSPAAPQPQEAHESEAPVDAAPVATAEVQAPAVAAEPPAAEPLDMGVRSAEDVLQSLAAELAAAGFVDLGSAATAKPAFIEVLTAEQTVTLTSHVEAALKPTPQEAAAAAVAEVIAANTAVHAAIATDGAEMPSVQAEISSDVRPDSEAVANAVAQSEAAAIDIDVAATDLTVPQKLETPTPALADAFEDEIANLLRPMLREWLDAHLPRMVEKALREELGQRPLFGSGGMPSPAA